MTVHVVGAGVAGLAAAMALLDAGVDVRVHEAAPLPGGRCRSYHDPVLDRRIDTGTHLLVGANRAALAYLRRLGALDRMIETAPAAYPFVDLASGRRWTVRPPFRGLISAFHPVALAALNTEPSEASWRLIASVFGHLLSEHACRPWIARTGIGDAMVDPAVARLGDRLTLGRRLTRIDAASGRAGSLAFGNETVTLDAGDRVILAVPPAAAAELMPDLAVPTDVRAIVNAHFRVAAKAPVPTLVGMTGSTGQWALWRGDVVSVTVSAADALLVETAETLAARFWPEIVAVFGFSAAMPLFRIVKERRATIAATSAMERLRPEARTELRNLALAGDWTRTGLPGTLEGAVCSGEAAVRLALATD